MKGLMFTLGAAAIVFGASNALAALVEADYQYDGNALPQNSTPAFSVYFDVPPDISETVSNGILTLNSPYGKDHLYRYYGAAWTPGAAGTTVETRVKLDSVSSGAFGAGDITLITNTASWTWQFRTDRLTEQGGNGTLLYADLPGGLDPTDGFHDFRFAITGESGPVNLYIDGNPTPAFTWTTGGGSNGARIDWGDNLGTSGGQMEWDYIQWTNDGAYAPVPEPASLSLLALGALALRRRRA